MLRRMLIVSLLAASAGGCSGLLLSSDRPYPAYGNPVNPTPAPGYRVVCRTIKGQEVLHFSPAYGAGCSQYVVPAGYAPAEVVVVKARG